VQAEFLLDCRSPVLLFGQSQAKRLGVQIVYTPVDIVSVMKKVTNQPSTMCPPKAKYAGIDSMGEALRHSIFTKWRETPFVHCRMLVAAATSRPA
jgi:2-hydroxychromene-2-carboxylate isomerase